MEIHLGLLRRAAVEMALLHNVLAYSHPHIDLSEFAAQFFIFLVATGDKPAYQQDINIQLSRPTPEQRC